MHMISPTRHAITVFALTALASAGCGNLDASNIYDGVRNPAPTAPLPNPCAATLCPTNTQCVVLKTNPPTASCEPLAPDQNPCAVVRCAGGTQCVVQKTNPPTAACEPVPPEQFCFSSSTCPTGSVCSTERGECRSACEGRDGVVCPAVCAGVCEKSDEMVNPCAFTLCPAQTTCVVLESYPPQASCQPLASPPRCSGASEGGPTSCKDADTWKRYAAANCEAEGKVLTALSFAEPCAENHSRYMKYECCTAGK